MDKALLLNRKPETIVNILNDIQKLIVFRKFPKDFRGWVYLYCNKGKSKLITFDKYLGSEIVCGYDCTNNKKHIKYGANNILNGKVVARFWCDNTYDIICGACDRSSPRSLEWMCREMCVSLEKDSCLTQEQLDAYLRTSKNKPTGVAVHISKLEVFDKAMELSSFGRPITYYENISSCPAQYDLYVGREAILKIKKAPTDYMWVVNIKE